MMTGLIHSLVRAMSGPGRYCATLTKAGLPAMQTVSKVNSSPSMNSSQLASLEWSKRPSAASRSAALSTRWTPALLAPAIGLRMSG
jgi:hypothetical protein